MMATRILFLGLVVLVATATQAAILFEDDFNGTTLDTGKWATSLDSHNTEGA